MSQKEADKILPEFADYSAKPELPAIASASARRQRIKPSPSSNKENTEEVKNHDKWIFGHAVETISPNLKKPGSKIKVLKVEPVVSNHQSVWFNSNRGNKFRVMEEICDKNEEERRQKIGRVFIGILQTIKDEIADKSSGKTELTKDQIVAIIDAAKRAGGISNKLNENNEYVENEGLTEIAAVDPKIAKYFSARFQQECEKCGIYTGREDKDGGVKGVKMVGLRLTFIPDDVVDHVRQKGLSGFKSDVRKVQRNGSSDFRGVLQQENKSVNH